MFGWNFTVEDHHKQRLRLWMSCLTIAWTGSSTLTLIAMGDKSSGIAMTDGETRQGQSKRLDLAVHPNSTNPSAHHPGSRNNAENARQTTSGRHPTMTQALERPGSEDPQTRLRQSANPPAMTSRFPERAEPTLSSRLPTTTQRLAQRVIPETVSTATPKQGSTFTSHQGPMFKDVGTTNINKGTFIQNNTGTVRTTPNFKCDAALID